MDPMGISGRGRVRTCAPPFPASYAAGQSCWISCLFCEMRENMCSMYFCDVKSALGLMFNFAVLRGLGFGPL